MSQSKRTFVIAFLARNKFAVAAGTGVFLSGVFLRTVVEERFLLPLYAEPETQFKSGAGALV